MNHLKFIISTIICCGILSNCSNSEIGYTFNFPIKSIKLKKELDEISGLCLVSDSTIACVQDEEANVYFLNIDTGEIDSSFDFGHNGDFEGLAITVEIPEVLSTLFRF